MIRQLKHSRVLRELWPGQMHLAYAGHGQGAAAPRPPQAASATVTQLPRRPDAAALSEAIPLFYIGRSKSGLWVVREAAGGSGGLFLFKQSAARFARRQSEPAGCAMMFLAEPFDLDVENQGGRVAGLLFAASEVVRRAPLLGSFVGSVVAEWRKLIAEISNAFAGHRRHRDAIEKELFRGQYTLSSKNDDDLPIP